MNLFEEAVEGEGRINSFLIWRELHRKCGYNYKIRSKYCCKKSTT
jgi:hypothetical protein